MCGLIRPSAIALVSLVITAAAPLLSLAQSQHSYPRLVIDNFRTIDLKLDSLTDEANKLGVSSYGLRTLAQMRLRMSGVDITERKDGAAIYVNVDISGDAYHVRVSMLRPTSYLVHGESRKTLAETWYDEAMGIHKGDRKKIDSAVLQVLEVFVNEYLRINTEYRPRR